MNKDALLHQLNQIHATIRQTPDIDAPTAEALSRIAADIRELVESKESQKQAEQAEKHTNLLEQIEKFEHDHPAVTRFLSQMTDFLAMIGI